jgi:hypothetical protein
MNFAVADGHSVVATKYVTSATEDAASLYFSTGTAFEPYSFPIPQPSSYLDNDHHPRQADQYRMVRLSLSLSSLLPYHFPYVSLLTLLCGPYSASSTRERRSS